MLCVDQYQFAFRDKLLVLGKRAVVKMSEGRYIIYLPTSLNRVWSDLHSRKRRVFVYIEIPSDKNN